MSLLAACSTPYNTPAFDARPGTPRAFPGAADLLRREGALDVLLVHGMCTHDAAWASGAARDLYANMGGDPAGVQLQAAPVGKTGVILFQQTLPLPAGSLRLNALLWSPLTTPLKGDLCYDQTSKSALCPAAEAAKAFPYDRARFNQMTKDSLINDCLADAMIYQGKPRIEINERMQAAILQAVNTTGGRPATAGASGIPVLVITDSVGSKITFDAIYRLATGPGKDDNTAGIALFNRTALVFMRANQMPILALADKQLDGSVSAARLDAGFPTDPIQALIQRRNAEPGESRTRSVPTVVAFSDPNDLLSYPLARSPFAAGAAYPIIDVIVSNAASYLGLVELPNAAHQDYARNAAVRRLIACGNPRSRACAD
ncbi:MAG TPA: hypothetical protein VFS02_00505 [Telluria sp.]|nr:hypothetical protein [Telluria sp.]